VREAYLKLHLLIIGVSTILAENEDFCYREIKVNPHNYSLKRNDKLLIIGLTEQHANSLMEKKFRKNLDGIMKEMSDLIEKDASCDSIKKRLMFSSPYEKNQRFELNKFYSMWKGIEIKESILIR
jgi:hypothetical protein